MQIETIADIGDNIEIKVNKDESKLARIIRIDIFSMDRGAMLVNILLIYLNVHVKEMMLFKNILLFLSIELRELVINYIQY